MDHQSRFFYLIINVFIFLSIEIYPVIYIKIGNSYYEIQVTFSFFLPSVSLFETIQISFKKMGNSRLNCRIVTPKGTQPLQILWVSTQLHTTKIVLPREELWSFAEVEKQQTGKMNDVLSFRTSSLVAQQNHTTRYAISIFPTFRWFSWKTRTPSPQVCNLPLFIRLVVLVPASPERLWSCSCWSLWIMLSSGLTSWFACWLRTWFNPVEIKHTNIKEPCITNCSSKFLAFKFTSTVHNNSIKYCLSVFLIAFSLVFLFVK